MVISFPSHSGVLQAINQPHGSALTVGMGWERLWVGASAGASAGAGAR